MPADGYETLLLERPEPHLLQVTLNRPQASNAFNTQMGRDLLALFQGLLLEPGPVRCVVLTGSGEKAFCAGGDLKERRGMTDDAWRAQHVVFEQAFYRLMDAPMPVIAAVNGAAYGGGCELALACDFIYASENARFALTEVTLGIIPGCGGTQNLPRGLGARRAKEVLYTGQPFDAAQGHAWGLINRLLPQSELLPAALETAGRIARNAPLAIRQAKRAVDLGLGTDLTTGLGIEIEAYNRLVPTEDRLEGVNAFNERRRPEFRGR